MHSENLNLIADEFTSLKLGAYLKALKFKACILRLEDFDF